MRLYTFELNRRSKVGVAWQGQLIDIHAAYCASHQDQPQFFPTDIRQFARLGEPALHAAKEALDFVKKRRAAPVDEQLLYPLDAVRILPPILRPTKIICASADDQIRHVETSAPTPSGPLLFTKLPSTIIGPDDPIIQPHVAQQLDYAPGFAAVIGQRMKNTSEADVMSCIFGYTILNDVTACDIQQLALAKNFDSFCPLGPCVVTQDEISHPDNLPFRIVLNGEVIQFGTTADFLFRLPAVLSYLSQFMTLEPGDIVSTSTRAGPDLKPPHFLKVGDTIALEVDGIGRLENSVTAEP